MDAKSGEPARRRADRAGGYDPLDARDAPGCSALREAERTAGRTGHDEAPRLHRGARPEAPLKNEKGAGVGTGRRAKAETARKKSAKLLKIGWDGRVRTSEWRNQNPLPYHLATSQSGDPVHCSEGARKVLVRFTQPVCIPHHEAARSHARRAASARSYVRFLSATSQYRFSCRQYATISHPSLTHISFTV